MTNKTWDRWMQFWIKLSAVITMAVIVGLVLFVFVKGLGLITPSFFTRDYDSRTSYVTYQLPPGDKGITLAESDGSYIVTEISGDSPLRTGLDKKGTAFKIGVDDTIVSVNGESCKGQGAAAMTEALNQAQGSVELKVKTAGHGIWPMLATTLLMVGLTLLIAVPIGIFAAVYLNEYARQGRLVNMIRFSIECLSGIPSIIYGLFGMLFFVTYLQFNYSVMAGVLTVSIILLPIIIRTTEEALKTVPMAFREGSLALGATRLETIIRLVLPNALPGILTAVVLSIGRIIGESAALFLTAGTVARVPSTVFESASTLTVKAYMVAKEEGNVEMACAIGVVIIILVLILNFCTRALQGLSRFRGGKS